MDKTIERKVISVICDLLSVSSTSAVSRGSKLIDDLGMESAKLLFLAVELEMQANFDVLEASKRINFSTLTTVGSLVDVVTKYQKSQ